MTYMTGHQHYFRTSWGNDGPDKQDCNFPSLTSTRKEWKWVHRPQANSPLDYRPLKMRPLDGIETLGNKHTATGRRLPEERNRFERLSKSAQNWFIFIVLYLPSFCSAMTS